MATILARYVDWILLATRPVWAVLMERTGLSRSSVAKWIAWLHAHDLLGAVTRGSLPQYRPGTHGGTVDDGRGAVAAEYVLTIPTPSDADVTDEVDGPVEETRTPSGSPPRGEPLALRAREAQTRPGGANTAPPSRTWSLAATVGSKTDALAAAEALRAASLDLRRISARHVRHLLTPFFAAGWTASDVLHALDHRTDGAPWPYAGMARRVPGWTRHRLAPWLDASGRPLPSKSQRMAAAAVDQRARQRAWREELEAQHARSLGGPRIFAPRMPRAEALAPAPAPATRPTAPTQAYRDARAALNARLAARP
ncbi:hypothetical protein ACFV1N_46050 [Streptosporangium canum]|uniref:hypothetical protein n=1 Tax=Streptosporangium canum TaxID=324952 RepID=UPI0036A4055F